MKIQVQFRCKKPRVWGHQWSDAELVDSVECPVDVSIRDDGTVHIKNKNEVKYRHNHPHGQIRFGLETTSGCFYPMPVRWFGGDVDDEGWASVVEGQVHTLNTFDLTRPAVVTADKTGTLTLGGSRL